eukprot:NODE_2549_length_773_cov_316.693370_g1779_i0.p2 GENE.NODE_2549_length_773_cov_316.693370_g1779_i0~~NODE_2549_length_773_cov_316.693370_g1779_i0.p2  ORF type:complete len:136 (-),score=43.11 NODE_2549_length_773_cov_316.693370_g1779_i0:338-745(-)
MGKNAERVAFRAGELAKKRAEQEQRLLELQQELQDREARLLALADKVRIVAKADPERLRSETEAFKHREDTDAAGGGRAWYGHHGYTEHDITKDSRFRLQEALGRAGLLKTDYARQMIAQVAPAPKPHLQSSAFS